MIAPARPLRINIVQGFFLPVPVRLGGAVEKFWYVMGRELARQGHHVTHISRAYEDLPADEIDAGVRYVRIKGHDRPAAGWKHKLLDLFFSRRAQSVTPAGDILVTNTLWSPMIERRADRGRPYLHVARYPKGQLRFCPQRALFQTVSSAIREAILQELPGQAERVRVIPYALSPHYYVQKEGRRAREILYTGRVHPEKGVHLLIEAFAQARAAGMQDWRLRIVGPWAHREGGGGEGYRDELSRRAAVCEGTVEFTGPIFDEQALVACYRRAAVFAYPSLADKGETFGLSVLEAMAAGCAPVVSDLACFRDFVEDGFNGVVFDHHSPEAAGHLAARLLALTRDEANLTMLQDAASRTARRYTLPSVADLFIKDFQAIYPG